MKFKSQKLFIFIFLLFTVYGCSGENKMPLENSNQQQAEKSESASAPQVLASTDNDYQITVPKGWQKRSDLNDQATLQASNLSGDLYVIIIRESKRDFAEKTDLAFYTDAIRENVQKALAGAELSNSAAEKINGFPALEFEAAGEVENLKLKYQYAVIETPQSFYQIITWTRDSLFDESKPQFLEIINSFKETGKSADAPPVAEKND